MWKVQVVKLGQVEVPVPEILFMTGFADWATMIFWMTVATDGNKVAIVNTGPPADLTEIAEAIKSTAAGTGPQQPR